MVKYATISVPLPAGGEEAAVARARAHLKAIRYRVLWGGGNRKVTAIGKRDWSVAAAVILFLFFIIGVIIYMAMRPPNRIQVEAWPGRVDIGYKGKDAYAQALVLEQMLGAAR